MNEYPQWLYDGALWLAIILSVTVLLLGFIIVAYRGWLDKHDDS